MNRETVARQKKSKPSTLLPLSKGVLQRRAVNQNGPAVAPPIVQEVLRSPGQPLDPATRAYMEPRFGHDFSGVRLHTDPKAAESARMVNALAYTAGNQIVFGPGQHNPETDASKGLLAHELTHTIQQQGAAPGVGLNVGPLSTPAEREADQTGEQVVQGKRPFPIRHTSSSIIQRQDKPKTSVSGERTGTKEGKDKFSFKAEVTVPLTPDLKFGAVSFLDDLKVTGTGGVTGEALGVSNGELDDMKLQLALTLAKLEFATTKDKAQELRKGKLSLGTTLNTTGTQTFAFDPFAAKSSLGASLTLKTAAVTPSLLSPSKGELTLSPSLSATGSLTRELGAEGKATNKAEGKVGLEASFKSPSSAALTLGGILGEKAQVTAGLEASASGSVTSEKTSGKFTAGGNIGLAGKGQGVERFVKLQLTGDVGIDQQTGSAAATTKSVFLGVTTGFKF